MDASVRLATRPAAAAAPVAWRYVDEARTHELTLEWRRGDPMVLVLRERAPGDPDEAEELLPLAEPWAARLRHWELETQLSAMGRYWRQQAGQAGWRPVVRPAGAPALDLRPSDALRRDDGSIVHHLHQRGDEGGRVLAALRLERAGERYQIVSAELDLAASEARGVSVLHARLPAGPARSRLARGIMELGSRGYKALVTREDYAAALGPAGARQAAAVWGDAVGRLRAGPLAATAAGEGEEAASLADFIRVLEDPRLAALHRRFLTPEEDAALVASSGPAIRRAVSQLRARAGHQEQHLLTVLEASLLARERLRHRQFRCSDPEVAALRRLAYYL